MTDYVENRIINLMALNVFTNWNNLNYFKISNIQDLHYFLFLNEKRYSVGEYAYIINTWFNLNININIIYDLLHENNCKKINIPIIVLFKYGILKRGPKNLRNKIQMLISKLELQEDVDYRVYTTENNRQVHYINILTFIKCLDETIFIQDLNTIINHYYTYRLKLEKYSSDYEYYFKKISKYFLKRVNNNL